MFRPCSKGPIILLWTYSIAGGKCIGRDVLLLRAARRQSLRTGALRGRTAGSFEEDIGKT